MSNFYLLFILYVSSITYAQYFISRPDFVGAVDKTKYDVDIVSFDEYQTIMNNDKNQVYNYQAFELGEDGRLLDTNK